MDVGPGGRPLFVGGDAVATDAVATDAVLDDRRLRPNQYGVDEAVAELSGAFEHVGVEVGFGVQGAGSHPVRVCQVGLPSPRCALPTMHSCSRFRLEPLSSWSRAFVALASSSALARPVSVTWASTCW